MMHPALITLLKLRGRGLLRRIGQGLQKPAGIFFAIFAAIIGVIWLLPVVMMNLTGEPLEPGPIRRYGPIILMIMTIGNMFNRNAKHSLHFSPAEIDLLYPAPFKRRELLTYKVSIGLLSSIGLGLMFSIFLLQFTSRWIFGFVSMTLAMLLVNLLCMAAVLASQYLGMFLRTFARKLIAGTIAATLIVWSAATIPIDRERGVLENIHAVLDSPLVITIIAPFSVFTEMLTAENWLVFAGMAAIAILMCIGTFAVNLLLDERNVEVGIEQGVRYHQRMQRAKKRSGMALTYSKKSTQWRVRELPWLGGAGPTLHRQFTTALRGIRSLFVPLTIQVAVFSILVVLIGRESPGSVVFIAVMGCIMFVLALPQMLLFDFRGDLDQMDWLKMLPIPPTALVFGELLTPVVIVTLLQWLLLGFTAAVVPGVSIFALVIVAALAIPLNMLNITLDNGMFLAYPTRRVAAGLADLTTLGRNMMLFIGKSFILIGCAGAAGLLGWLSWWIADGSWIAFGIAAWIVLAAACTIAIPIVAKLFQQFDVSRDMPA